jgi:hypothetical protein
MNGKRTSVIHVRTFDTRCVGGVEGFSLGHYHIYFSERVTLNTTLQAVILLVLSECTTSLLSITRFVSVNSGSVIKAEVVTQTSRVKAFNFYVYQYDDIP